MTSSIYSRDDNDPIPVILSDGLPTSPTRDYLEYSRFTEGNEARAEISPLGTPIQIPSDIRRHSDVSPLDENQDFFSQLPRQTLSQLPVPQRKPAHETVAAPVHPMKTETPMENDAARSSASKNVTFQTSRNASLSASAQTSSVDSRNKEASRLFSAGKERLQMFGKTRDQKQHAPPIREEWKGASGHFTRAPPVDLRGGAKQGKKARFQGETARPSPDYLNPGSNTYTVTTITAGPPPGDKLRSKTGQFRLRARNPSPEKKNVVDENASEAESAPTVRNTPESRKVQIDPVIRHDRNSPEASKESTPVLDLPTEPDVSDMFHDLKLVKEPQSRFSMSTYAPTEIAITPPGSSHSDIPPVPSLERSPIMTRRRPIQSSVGVTASTKRKPVSGRDTPTLPQPDNKSLSPEEQTQRRIDNLEDRRRQLSLRKESIKTMLHELTEVIQPSSIAYDLATREEVKKTVESLKRELDDIGKEDHDIGLKLVRLYKNLNKVSEYEQSSLWVKRITS